MGAAGDAAVSRFWISPQVCGNNFMLLRVAPPLAIEKEQMDAFVAAIRSVVEPANSPGSFWSEALGLARRRAFGN